MTDEEKPVREPTEEELAEAAEWRRHHFPGIRDAPEVPPASYNEAVIAAGGTPFSTMTHEEAKPVVAEMMRKYLKLSDETPLTFTEQDFTAAINAMPMEEYARKRQAIAAFRLNGP